MVKINENSLNAQDPSTPGSHIQNWNKKDWNKKNTELTQLIELAVSASGLGERPTQIIHVQPLAQSSKLSIWTKNNETPNW